jgi:hypothetical protein
MNKKIVLDGKEYYLVPVDDKETKVSKFEPSNGKVEDVLGDYSIEEETETGIKKAESRVSDYRERFKQKKISPREVFTPPKQVNLHRVDNELDRFSYKGEDLFFGEGLEEDF